MCDPCQESNDCVYVCLVIYTYTTKHTSATLLTWFTHIPPNTHIHYCYSPDMVHTYTTKHTYTQPLFSWHGSHIYHQTHIYTTATLLTCICVNHVRGVAAVYMCAWWYMCEPYQESSGWVYMCLVTTKHTYTQPLFSWHGSHIYHQTHIYTTATLLTWFTHIPPNTHIHNR
jgi:hypothetical protein